MHVSDVTTSPLTVSCDGCIMQLSAHCADCVVTHVVAPARAERQGRPRSAVDGRGVTPPEAIALTDEELHVVQRLIRAGMLPTLLHRAADHADSRAR